MKKNTFLIVAAYLMSIVVFVIPALLGSQSIISIYVIIGCLYLIISWFIMRLIVFKERKQHRESIDQKIVIKFIWIAYLAFLAIVFGTIFLIFLISSGTIIDPNIRLF